jgi:aromatic ring-cleaving dioxygenase
MENVIKEFHAHVYYHDDKSREIAANIRTYTEINFDVTMGRWRDQPVGPHPTPMFQIAFAPSVFEDIVPWLMLNRDGLSILVHPSTGDDVVDHRDSPLWLGEKLALNIGFLEAGNTSA